MDLLSYRKNIFSQNGEDGVIEELLKRLNITKGKFVEFGAWDGIYLSNTFNLLKNKNWEGFYIESDEQKFEYLKELKNIFPQRLFILNKKVDYSGENILDNLIEKHTNFPKTFELLSIDIDSFDYQVWKSVKKYAPIIVVVEVNSSICPPFEQVHVNSNRQGSSIMSMIKLGEEKGYKLVCHTGNCIFVKNEYIHSINLEKEYILFPEKMHIKM